MGIFGNVAFDIVTFVVLVILFSQIIVPMWQNKPFFPSVRGLRTIIRKTKDNVK